MTSVLFQSAKGGSSSDSAASNPFLALTHFYEQELTDQHIDARLNGHNGPPHQAHSHISLGKQPAFRSGYHHLFPSSPSSSSSSSSSSPHLPASIDSSISSRNGSSSSSSISKVYDQIHPQNAPSVQDEFRMFSDNQLNNPESSLPDSHLYALAGEESRDLTEYLKQRREYYAREAQLRSQDRHDGLGPIVDFSEQLWNNSPQEQEDHLVARHHNPYAFTSSPHTPRHRTTLQRQEQEQELQRQRMRAFSQQEQVLMDQAWDATNLPAATSTISPPPWPTARWAIETEAAFMGFESLWLGSEPVPQMLGSNELQGHSSRMQASEWSKEFSATLTNSSQQSNDLNSSTFERRGSLKTCGFMLDAKAKMEGLHDLPDPSILSSLTDTASAVDSLPSHDTRQDNLMEQPRQEYNDDVFEGNMLQAWMETLAQEKQEADERARKDEVRQDASQSEEVHLDEVEQRAVMEVALRRLNALMCQLNFKQGAMSGKAFKAARTASSTEELRS